MYRQISVCLMWMWLTHFDRSMSENITQQEDQELSDLTATRQERIESDKMFNEQASETDFFFKTSKLYSFRFHRQYQHRVLILQRLVTTFMASPHPISVI